VIGKFRKERDIPMQPDAQAALAEQLKAEDRLWKQNPQRLREVLAQGAERAKIARITPHALRHTFGTRWLQAGGDIFKLSKILGHSSVAVTEAHYAHLLKDDLVAASRQVKLPIGKRSGDNVVAMQSARQAQKARHWPTMAATRATSHKGCLQTSLNVLGNRVCCARSIAYGVLDGMPWAQGVAGSNPAAPTTF